MYRSLSLMAVCAALAPSSALAQSHIRPDDDPAVFRDCADCPEMRLVPAADNLPALALGHFEVTRDQFAAFIAATDHAVEPGCDLRPDGSVPSATATWTDAGLGQRGDHPVACVDWRDAVAYTNWLSAVTGRVYRLPTNAEWDRAADGSQGPSDQVSRDPATSLCDLGNVADAAWRARFVDHAAYDCNDGFVFTAPVGMKHANAQGFYDMLGNVWEWLADCGPDGGCGDGVVRGGGYDAGPGETAGSLKSILPRNGTRQSWLGFRVAAAPSVGSESQN